MVMQISEFPRSLYESLYESFLNSIRFLKK